MTVRYLIYVAITLLSTTVGSLSGMGGGAIMKPLFDLVREYSATQIAIMTSVTILVMALVSVVSDRKRFVTEKVSPKVVLLLAVGSVCGGLAGQFIFRALTVGSVDAVVKIAQNCVLLAVVAAIFIYMCRKEVRSLRVKNPLWALPVGLVLGTVSSFLGIGGGPLNVAVLVFVFGYSLKGAALCSLALIIFSQTANIITMIAFYGIHSFAILLLPIVVLAGIIGAFVGKLLRKKLTEKGVKIFFLSTQGLIFSLCLYNIVRYALAI